VAIMRDFPPRLLQRHHASLTPLLGGSVLAVHFRNKASSAESIGKPNIAFKKTSHRPKCPGRQIGAGKAWDCGSP
jgi:hypothetical protein